MPLLCYVSRHSILPQHIGEGRGASRRWGNGNTPMKLWVGMQHTPIVQKDRGGKGECLSCAPLSAPHPLILHVNRRLLEQGIELNLRRTNSNPLIVTTAVVTSCQFCATSRGTVYCHDAFGGGRASRRSGKAVHLWNFGWERGTRPLFRRIKGERGMPFLCPPFPTSTSPVPSLNPPCK